MEPGSRRPAGCVSNFFQRLPDFLLIGRLLMARPSLSLT